MFRTLGIALALALVIGLSGPTPGLANEPRRIRYVSAAANPLGLEVWPVEGIGRLSQATPVGRTEAIGYFYVRVEKGIHRFTVDDVSTLPGETNALWIRHYGSGFEFRGCVRDGKPLKLKGLPVGEDLFVSVGSIAGSRTGPVLDAVAGASWCDSEGTAGTLTIR